jgi:hypothetical protein
LARTGRSCEQSKIQANQRETLRVFGPKPFSLLDINKKQAGNAPPAPNVRLSLLAQSTMAV